MSQASTAIPAVSPVRSGRRRMPRAAAFVAIAAIFVLFLAASSAPSPLYVVYQREWDFSATTLTGVFAVYVLGLIGSLLVLGALSDHVGRRPVLAVAIGLEALSFVLFIGAGDVPMLFVARFLQGIATGAAMTTLGAALVDLDPPHARGRAGVINSVAPSGGLALGALGCGVLVQYAPAPTQLVWAILLAGMVVAAITVAFLPETSARRPGASASLQPRLGIPRHLRADVYALVPILVASWALGGLYLSLGPSIAAEIFGLTNHFVGGLVVTLLCGIGGLAAFALRRRPPNRVLRTGATLLVAGTVLTLAGIAGNVVALGIAGTAVSGVGFGASALAAFGTLARICGPAERGELFAAAYTISYLAFSLPAVVAGFATTVVGLRSTALVYSVAVIALGLAALAAQRMRARRGIS